MRFTDVFCCRELAAIVNDRELPFDYCPSLNYLTVFDCSFAYNFFTGTAIKITVFYCLWCGKPLVEDFYSELSVFEEEILGPGYYKDLDHLKKMPAEFQTDEWWRKRNLKLTYREFPESEFQFTAASCDAEIAPFCCFRLFDFSRETFSGEPNDDFFPMIYEPEKRRFFLASVSPFFFAHWEDFPSKKCWRLLKLQVYYCFWCGKELPKSLAKEWFEVATKKFGVRNVYSKAELQKKLPAKFLTDEWWREAGL